MNTFVLEAETRNPSQKSRLLRTSGRIPAVYYGGGKPTLSLQLPYQQFRKVFNKAGENTIIELSIEGKTHPVLVHDVQYDPITDKIAHIDFMHVNMEKEVTTSVKVNILGVAPAVKNLGGILDIQKHEIKIKCLPKDLIHQIDVDVSSIADFHTSIHVKDLNVPKEIKILDKPEDTVVTAVPPRAEEETKPAAPAEGAAATPTEGAAPPSEAAAQAGQPGAAAGKEAKK